ncbi:hypothetical protein RKT29_004207 [Salmonella enterica subsp. enterica serovar Lome]|nr:hypothetical protein [Salmonella enterica]EIP0082485.1 hypothetical protein [Salmonella enterica subsp. enterica serovar Ridge]ELD7744674.1 hypothetical protein [Salmonella enterica subsp. enterica serovar Lome]EHL8259086.1 hypothetical protein [Salmonella enterica]EIA4598800.1 hypothetical protein [Salmonella enterica]
MSNIDKQTLRETAVLADRLKIDRLKICGSTVLALLDELEATESKCRELAAENAHARERHAFIRALAVSILEHSGGRMDWRGAMADATELCQTVDSVYAKSPATNAFLAEVRAQGVEMAIGHIEQTICPNHETILNEFAARLRKGAAL